MSSSSGRADFPNGKRFAFTILDDTDVATVQNVKPIYDLFRRLGLRTTKTVWPLAAPEGSHDYGTSQTLEDEDYLQFVRELQDAGFEITWHCATMESSLRERTLRGLERFKELLGVYPRIHVNHAANRDCVYWGSTRVDQPLVKLLYDRLSQFRADHFFGHVEHSPYWWGDACSRHITYARNLTFNNLNVAAVNPTMPYADPRRPLVAFWFSASDAEDVDEFNELLRPEAQDRLESEGGFCIVATHLGKGFVRDGVVHQETRALLERLASRNGWFPTTGELLDWLRAQRTSHELPATEWRRMQWRWARDLGIRKVKQHIRVRRMKTWRHQ
jgi:hypothetical protein